MNDFINVGDKVYYDAGGGQETWRVMWKDADEEEVQLQNSQGATTFAHVNSVNKIAAEQPKPSEDIEALWRENERLREALTYDWDQLEACRESLREHMVEIKRLRELLTEAKDLAWAFGADSLRDRINEVLQEET